MKKKKIKKKKLFHPEDQISEEVFELDMVLERVAELFMEEQKNTKKKRSD